MVAAAADHIPPRPSPHFDGDFDLVLMSGAKIRDRLQEAGLLKTDGYAIVGYPKFDHCATAAVPPRLFDNDRPTVLYNPHCSPRLSSRFLMSRTCWKRSTVPTSTSSSSLRT